MTNAAFRTQDTSAISIHRVNTRPLTVLAICVGIAYLLPYHTHPFRAFYADWIMLFGVIVAIAFVEEKRVAHIRVPFISAIPLGLAAVIVIQTSFGMLGVSWDAVLPIAYLLVAALAMVLGATLSASENGTARVCHAIAGAHLIAGLASVFIATIQFLEVETAYMPFVIPIRHDAGALIRPYANVAQPNQLALLFCISIASVWWLYQAGKLRKVIAIGFVAVLTWGLALTQSRIGWLIVPAFGLFAWIWRKKSNYKIVSSSLIAGYILLYGWLIFDLPSIASALGIMIAPPAERIGGGSERLVLLQQALQISLANPWFGAGWYEFGPQQVMVGADFPPSIYSQHAHNLVLNFAAEVGWPITGLIFGALGYWFFRACLQRDIPKEIGFATLFFIAVLIHSMAEFPLWYAYVLLPVALMMGMVHQVQFGTRERALPRIFIMALFCLLSAGLVAIATDYRRLVVNFRALGWESLGLKADEGTTHKPELTLFPHFYDYFRFAKTKAREGMSPQEIAFMERTAKRFGYAPVLMRMSLVYGLNGRPDDAVRAMATISRLHPGGYEEAYYAWKNMADAAPEKYTAVFTRLSKPDPVFSRVKPGSNHQ